MEELPEIRESADAWNAFKDQLLPYQSEWVTSKRRFKNEESRPTRENGPPGRGARFPVDKQQLFLYKQK